MFGLFKKKAEPDTGELKPGIVRERVRFYGTVQHVGFRFQLRMLARDNGIAGWVNNQEDGSVLAEFQGMPEQIEKLLLEARNIPRVGIEKTDREKISPVRDEKGFRSGY